jgi:hypothetical protein
MPFFANSWEAPPGFADAQASSGGWTAVVDSAVRTSYVFFPFPCSANSNTFLLYIYQSLLQTGKTYYHNSITNATSWDVPAGFNAGGGDVRIFKRKDSKKRLLDSS